MFNRIVRGALLVSLAAATSLAWLPNGAQAAGTPGWRIVWTDHAKGQDNLLAIAATGTKNAWAGGSAGFSSSSWGKPVAEHWDGHAWNNSVLPPGLTGATMFIRASGPTNVWAFGEDNEKGTAFAVRWDGRKWTVMKRWSNASWFFAGALVFGPNDVWVANSNSNQLLHYTGGNTWRSSSVPGVMDLFAASGLSSKDIWVVGQQQFGTDPVVAHGVVTKSGFTWQITQFPVFPQGNAGPPITGIYERTASDAWALGGNLSPGNKWYPNLAHWNGRAWQRVNVTGNFILANAISDDHGGLWVTTGWDSTGIPPHLMHFTAGRFTSVPLAKISGRYVGIYGLTDIPGSTSVWGAGALTGLGSLGNNTAVILKYGT
jgi:hypothetical protein